MIKVRRENSPDGANVEYEGRNSTFDLIREAVASDKLSLPRRIYLPLRPAY